MNNEELRPNFDSFGEWYAKEYNLDYLSWHRDTSNAMTIFAFRNDYTFWLGITDEYLIEWGNYYVDNL